MKTVTTWLGDNMSDSSLAKKKKQKKQQIKLLL